MTRTLGAIGLCAVLFSTTAACADDLSDSSTQGDRLVVEHDGATIKLGDYWIGLMCHPVDDALRERLNLPKGQGVKVVDVVPDSPADKSGIEPKDVLLAAGKTPIKNLQDLIDAIQAAGGKELTLRLNRNGETKQVEVTPAERPEEIQVRGGHFVPIPGPDDWNKLHEWIERMQSGAIGRGPMQFRFMHPGTILPPGANVRPPLPDNMTVIVTKQGAEPANVVVRRNDESWEITEKELDQLPDDVRKHVELILGNFSEPLHKWIGRKYIHRLLDRPDVPLEFVPDWPTRGRMSAPILKEPAAASSDSFEKRLERRFDEMNHRIEQIHKLLEQMRM